MECYTTHTYRVFEDKNVKYPSNSIFSKHITPSSKYEPNCITTDIGCITLCLLKIEFGGAGHWPDLRATQFYAP